MRIVLVGAGNVATVLSRLSINRGHHVVQVISQHLDSARKLSEELGCSYTTVPAEIEVNCDFVLVAVSDINIEHLEIQLADRRKPIIHTAGSVSKEVLKKYSDNYGVLYPLQTLQKSAVEFPDIPFLVDGNNEPMIEFIEGFAQSLSDNVQRAGDEERRKLHLAAVFAGNFTNHMYTLAENYCKNENISFDSLKPLILETAKRILTNSPAKVQTGPAVRNDVHTMEKHIRLLTPYPKLRTTYIRLTDSIINP